MLGLDTPSIQAWGWLPALGALATVSMLLVAVGDSVARLGIRAAEIPFWVGLVILYAPITVRLSMAGLTRRETISLIVILGLGLYVVKLLHSPNGFSLFDEFLHWRTTDDIIRSNHLYYENPMLPVSSLYPGLESATDALVSLSGLSIFQAGVLLLGVARVVMVLALYLFYETIGQSRRVAGLAVALYMANPNFVFFDAQFAYESLALPLTLLVLAVLMRRSWTRPEPRAGLNLVAMAGVWAIAVTHHVTSYVLTVILLAWAVINRVYNRWRGTDQPGPGWIAAWALAVNLGWLVGISNITMGYFAPHFIGAVQEIVRLTTGEQTGRQLFHSTLGQGAPFLEQLTALAAVGLTVLGLPLGLLQWWQRHRDLAIGAILAAGALVFPLTLALRLTQAGWDIGVRSASFLYLGVAYMLALAVERLALFRRQTWHVVFGACVAILLAGGVIAGNSPWSRLPGPYTMGAGPRSISSEGIDAAEWTRTVLGPDNPMAADRTNTSLMGSYGGQWVITNLAAKVSISGIFLAPQLRTSGLAAIRQAHIHYLVVDRRLSTALPIDGSYYETWERQIVPYTKPPSLATLEKFSTMKNVNLVFDSGNIEIYDVGALAREP